MIVVGSVFAFLIGTVAASTLLTFFWRTQHGKKWITGRSVCDFCDAPLAPLALVPVFGRWFVRTCSGCNRSTPWYSTFAEILVGLSWVFVWHLHATSIDWLSLFAELAIITVLIVTAIVDFYWQEISLPTLIGGMLVVFLWYVLRPVFLTSGVVGAVAAAGFFLWQYILSRGRWIGSGDIWVGAFLGLVFGWNQIVLVLAVGYCLAALAALIMVLIFHKQKISSVPLGGWLCVSGIVFWLHNLL